ncbi:MAG: type II toxin-antitoxin system HicA family toxin [Ignavibacteriae bacterium]|nr:type II toxin-antitoxin system HicA family toxin [Ignavibacteriota bacterium]
MGEFANISGEKAVRIFSKFGYIAGRQTGSHIIIYHETRPTLSVPNHKELSPFLLKSLIKKSGIEFRDFIDKK